MNWSRRHIFALGAALIVATNAVALLGVAYNRSGTPDSELRLSQRELRPPFQWGLQRENSGLSLTLVWRAGEPYGSSAAWLDRAKLTELGFDLSRPVATPAGRRYYAKLRSREVYLVLELDGSPYQAALDAARERAEKRKAEALAHPGDARLKMQADFAENQLFHEEHEASRLFAIDAGLDAGALRAKYADRSRYAIVRGRVRPALEGDGARVDGYITAVINDSVNVPLDMRKAFEGVTPRSYGFGPRYAGPTIEATVAFGRRFEPWLVGVARKP
ncbi:MAG TPA: DUF4824 family protein [Burkholderiales bacterium]|nr:DUF4824 family protein [Burkholderiales bacterium]